MAFDEYLLNSSQEFCSFRLYQWHPAALSLGYAQKLERHVNVTRCRELNVPVYRRMTGGKAVFHDRELTYAITGPVHLPPFSFSLLETYRVIGEAFLEALNALGIPAVMAPNSFRAQGAGISSCFAQPSAYEILAGSSGNPRKIIGSAQKRTRTGVLQHGSLLLGYDPERWGELLVRSREHTGDHAASLEDLYWKEPPLERIKQALVEAFEHVLQVRFEPVEVHPDLQKSIRCLAQKNYSDLTLKLDSHT